MLKNGFASYHSESFACHSDAERSEAEESLYFRSGAKIVSAPILLVGDLLHPVNHLAILLFLNSNVRHGRGRRGAVPVLLAGLEPDHITRPNFLNRASPALSPAAACHNNQSLSERMHVPRGSRARFESDAGALNECRIGGLEKRIDPYRAGEA